MSNQERQIFSQPVTQVIKARKSVRTYKNQPLTGEVKKSLEAYFSQLKNPLDIIVRVRLIHSDVAENRELKLGTYGLIKGSSSYILSMVEKGELSLVALGYSMEKLVLYATSLGLGTCWLAGFNKGEFSKAVSLGSNEILPAVSPIGYGNENQRFLEKMMKMATGAAVRKPWNELFFSQSFGNPLSEGEAGGYAVPLEMVRLAPSASNKQPWRVVKEGGRFHFYVQRTKAYGNMLGFDVQKIDMGIALCHFDLTAGEAGLKGSWKAGAPAVNPVPDGTEYIISWVENE